MERLEIESRKRTKRVNLKKIILGTVAVAGVLGVAMVAPNVLGAMGKLGLLPHKRQGEFVNRARERLVRQGLLKYQDGFVRLTPAGERVLRAQELVNYSAAKPKRWDGKWRVLIFDIPERRKKSREQVRRTLQTIGFIRLQDSVWLYPYDCEELLVLLKADFRIGKDMRYLVVDALEYDQPYRRHFGLIR